MKPHATLFAMLVLVATAARGQDDKSYQPGVDLSGFDYSNFELLRPQPRLCQETCLNDSKCKAWTFVWPGPLSPRAQCWLKQDVPEPRANACCVSGVRR